MTDFSAVKDLSGEKLFTSVQAAFPHKQYKAAGRAPCVMARQAYILDLFSALLQTGGIDSGVSV